MSRHHPNNVRRTFKVRCIHADGTSLYYGQELTVIGDDGKQYQVEDERGRKGVFSKTRFERVGLATAPKPARRVKQAPAEPIRCVVLYRDAAMSYDPAAKVLEYKPGDYTVFCSRKEANKAIWHTVHALEWREGYDPREAASHYVIMPDNDSDRMLWPPSMKYRQVRW